MKETRADLWWDTAEQSRRDFTVADYLVSGYEEKDPAKAVSRTQAGYPLSHLRYSDPLGVYRLSRRVAAIWICRAPPSAAWPMTPGMTEAMAGVMLMMNNPAGETVHP